MYDTIPLNKRRSEIRILRLQAALFYHNQVVCDLEAISLDGFGANNPKRHPDGHGTTVWPEYEALSYTWGASKNRNTIRLGQHSFFPVTDNLHAALCRLRQPDRDTKLWVDALCINQSDSVERSWQIRMMPRIYSLAQEVIVWLGDAGKFKPPNWRQGRRESLPFKLDTFMDVVNRIDFKLPSMFDVNDVDSVELRLKSDDKRRNDILKTMKSAVEGTKPHWWTRAWIVQEFALAHRLPRVCFGPYDISWEEFREVGPKLLEIDTGFCNAVERLRFDITHGGVSLLDLFAICCSLNATDARDKVYGMLGLVKDGEALLIQPDYSATTVQAYTRATHAIIEANGNLDSLYYSRAQMRNASDSWQDKRCSTMGLPSWAIDFSANEAQQQSRRSRLSKTDISDKEFRPATPSVQLSDDGTIAWFSGLTFDTVKKQRRYSNSDDMPSALKDIERFTTRGRPNAKEVAETANQGVADAEAWLLRRDFLDWFRDGRVAWYGNDDPWIGSYLVLFATESGYAGIGPETLRDGDKLVLLHGSLNLALLRPLEGYFEFLGFVCVFAISEEYLCNLQHKSDSSEPEIFKLR